MTRIAIAFASIVSLFLTGCGQSDPAANLGEVLRLSDQFTGDFDLVDTDGNPVRDEDFDGKIMFVYFGFSSCPANCPRDTGDFIAALNEVEAKDKGAVAKHVAPLFITLDPERDTPSVLKDHLSIDDRIIGLTGTTRAADEARLNFKVMAERREMPDSALGYTIDHYRAFFITDRNGQPQYAVTGGSSPQFIAKILRRSINEF